jgi:ammonium transporter, Amt family
MDYFKYGRKFSVTGVCEGIIAGLVGITPAAGYVSVWCAAAIGFITAVIISLLQNINDWIGIGEGMDIFKLHGMGGIVGSFLTGIFATASVSSLDGVTLAPGGIDGNGIQVGKQFAEIAGISSYAFMLSLILCYVLKYIPGMHLCVSDEAEMVGLDLDQFFDEQIGDWSLFDHTNGIPQDGKMTCTPVTPPPEEEKQSSKV